MRLTSEERQHVIDMVLAGQHPVKYIESLGVSNPLNAWWYIRKHLKEHDPETYAKLPDNLGKLRQVETPEGEFTPATLKIDGPIRIEATDVGAVDVVETPEKPKTNTSAFPFKIRSIETNLGTYAYDDEYFEFKSSRNKSDAIELEIEDFILLAKELPEVMKMLGVKL